MFMILMVGREILKNRVGGSWKIKIEKVCLV